MLTLLLALLVIAGPLALPRLVNRSVALAILLVGLAAMGAAEWTREALRKPWVVFDYIYSNGVLATEVDALRAEGVVANSPWIDPSMASDPVAHGKQIFRAACQNCHARTGYNGMRSRVQHWDEDYAAAMITRLEFTRRRMPPWVGTDEEARAVAAYLMTLEPAEVPALDSGAAVFVVRCSPCHSIDGFRAIKDLVEGLSAEEIVEYMDYMESVEMPPFTGSDAEAELLAAYLASLHDAPVTATTPPAGTKEDAR